MAGTRSRARSGRSAALAVALALTLPATLVHAGTGDAPAETGESPRVELEKLLELPASREYSVKRRGGASPGEWRSRFRSLREELAAEREALEEAEAELEEVAGTTNAWNVGPTLPGANTSSGEAPLDYRLRQKIRRHRDEIERLERKLRELEVEANLAGVPDAWREPASESGRGAGAASERP